MKKIIKSALTISFILLFPQFGGAEADSLIVKSAAISQPAGAVTASQPGAAADAKPVQLYADSQSTVVNDTSEPAETTANVPAARDDSDYTINAGDVLQITVWKEAALDKEVLVLPDGTITFPLIGSFNAEGKTPAEVQQIVKEKLRSLIPSASVTVMVKAALGHSVSVIGQVTRPGEIVMGHRLTVMQALSQAGGLTPYASESDIIILRRRDNKETSIPFPYDDVISGHDLDKDILLTPGDVVVVPTAGLF